MSYNFNLEERLKCHQHLTGFNKNIKKIGRGEEGGFVRI